MNINSYLVLGKFNGQIWDPSVAYTKKNKIRHKHVILYPLVKFECFNKLLWYGKNIICVFANQMHTKTKKTTIENIWDNRMINTRRSCDGRKWSWKCAMLNVDDRTLPHIRRRWSHGCLRPMTDIFAITCGQRKICVGSIASIARTSYV